MKIFPAIDLYGGRVVRLLHGDYDKMTVYSADPAAVALKMRGEGAQYLHTVDLSGARDGVPASVDDIRRIKKLTGLFIEIGGGIRDMRTADAYFDAGADRVILGTAAVNDPAFLSKALEKYGSGIAVGADVRGEDVAVKGWLQSSGVTLDAFCQTMQSAGVRTLICTDISRDGAMRGANRQLYARLQKQYSLDIVASGGVSSVGDVRALAALGLYGAIIGRAYYENALGIAEAKEAARDN